MAVGNFECGLIRQSHKFLINGFLKETPQYQTLPRVLY